MLVLYTPAGPAFQGSVGYDLPPERVTVMQQTAASSGQTLRQLAGAAGGGEPPPQNARQAAIEAAMQRTGLGTMPSPTSQQQQQQHFSKGDTVLYRQRDGTLEEAKVRSAACSRPLPAALLARLHANLNVFSLHVQKHVPLSLLRLLPPVKPPALLPCNAPPRRWWLWTSRCCPPRTELSWAPRKRTGRPRRHGWPRCPARPMMGQRMDGRSRGWATGMPPQRPRRRQWRPWSDSPARRSWKGTTLSITTVNGSAQGMLLLNDR